MWWLGLEIETEGSVPVGSGPVLLVGNHRSYLDPIIVLTVLRVLPIAKAEVSRWPLVGAAARATGIIFVWRERRDSRAAALQAMESKLRQGYSVLVYPEGTTHVNPYTSPFKAGAFRVAAAMDVPVVPVAIEYQDEGDAWVGDDTFVAHFLRTFGRRRSRVRIAYGPALTGADPAELSREARQWIDERLTGWHRQLVGEGYRRATAYGEDVSIGFPSSPADQVQGRPTR
ncbi:MAG: hypothetical protein RLY31_3217 [Bacteroidota bacterium]|jgi:1-acyl-sn-glycerol-3-phosphate acyltransferase